MNKSVHELFLAPSYFLNPVFPQSQNVETRTILVETIAGMPCDIHFFEGESCEA